MTALGLIRSNIFYENFEEDLDQSVPRCYYGIVINKGVCADYAAAVKYLMTMAGLNVICADWGIHAWNMIRLDGKWYEFDCTWEDEKEISDWSWFNRSTAAISRNDSHWTFLPERMPYAETDMPFTEYCRFGDLTE